MKKCAILVAGIISLMACKTTKESGSDVKEVFTPGAAASGDGGEEGIFIAAVNVTSSGIDAGIRNIQVLHKIDRSGRRVPPSTGKGEFNVTSVREDLKQQLIEIGKSPAGQDRIVFKGRLKITSAGPLLPAFIPEASIERFFSCGRDTECNGAVRLMLTLNPNVGSGPVASVPGNGARINYRVVAASLGGPTQGSREGAFTASSQAEWNRIFSERMDNSVPRLPSAPNLGVDFSREFIWGYQIVSGSVAPAHKVREVLRRGDVAHVVLVQEVSGPNCSGLQLPAFSAPSVIIALERGRFSGISNVSHEIQQEVVDCR